MDKANRGGTLTSLMPLIFFFVLCCGVLACIFARAADLSYQAGRLNTAVQICRSGAEVYTACGSAAQTEETLGGLYFDLTGEPVSREEAQLRLTIREQDREGLGQAEFEIHGMDGEPVYTLTASVFRKEGQP